MSADRDILTKAVLTNSSEKLKGALWLLTNVIDLVVFVIKPLNVQMAGIRWGSEM